VESLEDFCKASRNDVVFGSISILFFFSLIGIPPFLGFWIKFRIITSLVSAGFVFVAMVILFLNVFSIFYYLRIVKEICFGNDRIDGNYLYPSGSNLFYDLVIVFCFLNVFGFIIFDCFEFFLLFLINRIL
jgi:NADH-quinone oxidoreductase subunit N